MKSKINKSQLMQRAWNIYRGRSAWSGNFSCSLRKAWEVEKANIAYEEEKAARAAEQARVDALREERRRNNIDTDAMWRDAMESLGPAIAAWYDNAPHGTYFGD